MAPGYTAPAPYLKVMGSGRGGPNEIRVALQWLEIVLQAGVSSRDSLLSVAVPYSMCAADTVD